MFFLFLQGEKFFFNLCGSQGELLLFIGGVVSISNRVELFLCSLNSLFSLILYYVCLLIIELSLSIRDKKGEIQMKYGWESCLFCLRGDTLIVYDNRKYKYVLVYLTQGESYFAYLLFSCFLVFIFYTCGYAFCLVFQEIYMLIQLSYCLHLQLMDSSYD